MHANPFIRSSFTCLCLTWRELLTFGIRTCNQMRNDLVIVIYKKQQQVDIIFIHNILGILVSSFDSDLYIYSKMQLNERSSQ